MSENRLLILLNPGRQSRHYMLGLTDAARRLGISHAAVEMADLWHKRDSLTVSHGLAAACSAMQSELARVVRQNRITHVIGYAWNGALDFGLVGGAPGEPAQPLFAALGLRHVMLWTDHPEWFSDGAPIQPGFVPRLNHPLHTHILKSRAAADEAGSILGWQNTVHMSMAEDFPRFNGHRGRDRGATRPHDVVAIMGGFGELPPEVQPFLSQEAPDPAAIDLAVRDAAIERWVRWLVGSKCGPEREATLQAAGVELINAKIACPRASFWTLSGSVSAASSEAIGCLQQDPQRWYGAVQTLRKLVDWRRWFYVMWLAKRSNIGIYGSSTAAAGVPQPDGADRWVEYDRQAEVYGKGWAALNINAAHDEEGCTHKPFQIASGATACVHHTCNGLGELFDPGEEVEIFERPAELLATVKTLASNPRRAREMGHAMHERARREHTWDNRLPEMLALADAPAKMAPLAAAA